jgi:hypothetical protein
MKKILLLDKKNPQEIIGEFNSIEEAQKFIIDLAQEDEDISIFDYSIKEVEDEDVSTTIPSYESAKDKLGSVAVKVIPEVREHHAKALNALNKLFTIAEAWNKVDNFIPDFSNRNQYKYFPWFVYNDNAAGVVFAYSTYTASSAYANFGSRLCFSTSERAEQFGKQFIDLWNDFLLFR